MVTQQRQEIVSQAARWVSQTVRNAKEKPWKLVDWITADSLAPPAQPSAEKRLLLPPDGALTPPCTWCPAHSALWPRCDEGEGKLLLTRQRRSRGHNLDRLNAGKKKKKAAAHVNVLMKNATTKATTGVVARRHTAARTRAPPPLSKMLQSDLHFLFASKQTLCHGSRRFSNNFLLRDALQNNKGEWGSWNTVRQQEHNLPAKKKKKKKKV